MKRFRGGLAVKARRLSYHSTLGWRVTKKKKKAQGLGLSVEDGGCVLKRCLGHGDRGYGPRKGVLGVGFDLLPRKALRGGISKSILQRPCQFLVINAHKMAPRTT